MVAISFYFKWTSSEGGGEEEEEEFEIKKSSGNK